MQDKLLLSLRSLGAVLAGYAVIVLGTTLTLTVLLEGKSYAEVSLAGHAVGAVGTVLSGLLGGYLAARLAGRGELWHALAVAGIVAVEASWIVTASIGSNPAWFDAAGGLTLMGTALLGGWARAAAVSRPRPASAG